MNALLANWKTSIPALGLVLVAIGHAIYTGQVSAADITAIFGALGLGAAQDAGK